MKGRKIARLAMALLMGVAFALPGMSAMAADTPPNDYFANATVIGALPFNDSVDNTNATTEEGEPQNCEWSDKTVWYSFTPATNGVFKADMEGGLWETTLRLWQATGPEIGDLMFMSCASWGSSTIVFHAQGGVTYYFQAGNMSWSSSGTLQFHLQQILPPPNDNWADATAVTALPFEEAVDVTAANFQKGERIPTCANSISGTAWYAFTPQENITVSAYVNGPYDTLIAAYTGDSLSNLTEQGCRAYGGRLTFRANAGTTYYFQVARLQSGVDQLWFHIEATPPPQASFGFWPSDPSVFDEVHFDGYAYDPGEIGIETWSWDLGDGTTVTGVYITHQYARDGDYTVRFTVTTPDGRTASASQVVHVKTHDVAIVRLGAPQSASAGQTRQVTVDIRNTRYPENVRVELLKSVPGGFQSIGMLTMFVPVRPSNRTTQFSFSYTFTADDARIGKVTFRAVANLVDARDALPADNEAISSPTKVGR